MSTGEHRASAVLLTLAAVGILMRWIVGGTGAPGAVGYLGGGDAAPGLDSVARGSARLARPLGPNERIDMDVADASELSRLPRIGAALAARIVADRDENGPFGSLEAVTRVAGIGPSVRDVVRRHVTFSGAARPAGPPVGRPLDLNSASAEELTALPGIGPVRAAAIVAARSRVGRFRRIEDLLDVPGIGPGTVERLRPKVRIS